MTLSMIPVMVVAAINNFFTLSAGTETTTIAEVTLEKLKTTVGAFIGWFGQFLTFVGSQPLLLIGVAIFVASAVIYLTYKALHGRG